MSREKISTYFRRLTTFTRRITPEPFSYESALVGRKIRLLRISPASGIQPVHIFLSEKELDGDTSFLALSYVWGSPDVTEAVICNGKTLLITKNLHAALWQMREDGWQGYVWADAICINQKDLIEKTSQVRMMAEVYEHAEKVLVWLGEGGENEQMGYNLMVRLCERGTESGSSTAELSYKEAIEQLDFNPDAWTAMINLLRRPWFWRAWVVQEYHLARNKVFQCGGLIMAPEPFFGIQERFGKDARLKSLAQTLSPHIWESGKLSLIGSFFNFSDYTKGGKDLFSLLKVSRGLESSDKRDRVFALVGLSSDAEISLIDYDLELRDILIQVAKDTIQIRLKGQLPWESLDCLCFTDPASATENIPSWVPTYEIQLSLVTIFPLATPLTTKPKVAFGENVSWKIC
jgi:Heterokaryon incompatibility protein (HET)